jgi:hypothetical protein
MINVSIRHTIADCGDKSFFANMPTSQEITP